MSVMKAGSTCPEGESNIRAATDTNLLSYGFYKAETPNEEPDWGLIIGKY